MKYIHILDRYIRFKGSKRRKSAPNGVLIVSSGGIGDTILLSHVINRFQSLANPSEKVHMLIRAESEKVTFLVPSQVEKIIIDFTKLRRKICYRVKVLRTLYNHNFRLVISSDYLRHPFLDEALILSCQAPENAAMIARPWKKYQKYLDANINHFNIIFDSGPAIFDKLMRWSNFLDHLIGEKAPPPVPKIQIPKPTKLSTDTKTPLIIIQPFSAVREKEGAPELYNEIINHIPNTYKIVFTGTQKDLDRCPKIQSLLKRRNIEFDNSSFEEIICRLRTATLVITSDSAMLHLSIAMGATTLCLASAAYVGEIVPYSDETKPKNAHFYYIPMKCQSCLGNCNQKLIKEMFPCIALLDSGVIIEKVNDILGLNPQDKRTRAN